LNQQRRKQQPISNVTGDKGNDTIIDVDEYEDVENGSGEKRNAGERHTKEQPRERIAEQGPDYFDNIDNIDVNIEETFSANQQALYIQNFSNLGNLS
jgi:transcription initiation factor TFIIIB Brf1 subunit/transcription initiation factor TFIIB